MPKLHIEPIPISERKSAFTMGLLWVTMVTSFPSVIAGFEWYRQGITLSQLIVCTSLSLILLLLYSVPACEMGARSGLGYCVLGKIIFGRWGGGIITTNLIWLFVAWYALTAVLMAQAVQYLFHLPISLIWLSIICAFLMSVNNIFGFKGIANFARFLGAPVLITWVLYIFFKAFNTPIPAVIPDPPAPSNMYALSITSSFIIGFAVWGNEQDYWRYAKPGLWRSTIPLLVAVTIGQIIFPSAGWLIARTSGMTETTSTLAFMSSYCFGSAAFVGLIILMADYFSANDSSLFGCAAAVESIWPFKHSVSVSIFAIVGALVAALISITNISQALSALVSLNCIILPTPTIIMLTEWFLRRKVFHLPTNFMHAHDFIQPIIRWPAIIALLCGILTGIITSGLIPAFEPYHLGICSVQAWLTSMIIYIPLRIYEHSHLAKNYAQNVLETVNDMRRQ